MSSLGRQKQADNSKSYSVKSYNTHQDSRVVCIHCKSSRLEAETQITQLKDKAHQSFMQVLQIQQLHDQQLALMREQFQDKQNKYRLENQQLRRELTQVKSEMALLEKNVRRHSYDFGAKELVIDNIDAILCEQGQTSYLDQSQLVQFKDLINTRNANDYVSSLRKQIYRDFKFVSNHKTQIQKLFILIKQLKDQNVSLTQKNEELTRKASLHQNQIKTLKNSNEGLNREIKFITEQIKKINSDKLQLQKKVTQLQKSSSQQSSKIKPNTPILQHYPRSLSPNHKQPVDKEESIELECSQLCQLPKQINELNYAHFIATEQQLDTQTNFKKRCPNQIVKH